MALFNLSAKNSFEKDLRSLPKHLIPKIINLADLLATNPFPPHSLKLRGAENLYRLRIGDYRLIYEVHFELSLIILHHIQHRREAYRRF